MELTLELVKDPAQLGVTAPQNRRPIQRKKGVSDFEQCERMLSR